MAISDLPALNATLNGIAGALLALGYYFIRDKRVAAHRACMLSAFVASTLFLVSYLIYHSQVGSRPFPGHGGVRLLYFTILITHIVLAAAIVPMALITLRRGLKLDVARHRRIARWTWPLWMYVSVTGVVIYVMLYRLY
jgi:putative membrane protein